MRELAESGSDRPTLTVAEIIAAGESFLAIVPKELAKGNIVELGDFGSFWLRTTTEGAETAVEVRADQISTTGNVTFPHLNFKSEVAIIWIRSV